MTSLPPVIRAASVNRSIEDAFRIFTEEIGAWWPLPTHGLFGDRSASVVFTQDSLVERSSDGSEVVWGNVLVWEPPHRLVIAWDPGGDGSAPSEVDVTFEADASAEESGGRTRVIIEHRNWETFGEAGMERRQSYVGPNAWGYVLDHFADGAEPHADAVDVTELTAAYEGFFAEAEGGGFGEAPEGEWNAEQVLAHVALNDAAMLVVCQAIVHQQPTRFENEVCQDPEVLASFISSAGSREELIHVGRRMANLVTASLRRLSPAQLETEVHCRLRHYDQVMADRPIPWKSVVVDTQAAMHLPAHVEQLRNLRS